MDESQFAQDRKIDPTQLDIEAVIQADKFFHWAQQAVDARREMDGMKLQLDTTEALLSLDCRKDPEKFGLGKVTEASITAAVKVTPTYKDVYGAYLDSRRESMLLDRAVEAMEQRKRMIEILVTLHGQQYFAGPSVPRDLMTAWREHEEATSESVNQKQRASLRRRGQDRSLFGF